MSEFDPNTTEFDYLIGVKMGSGQRPYRDTDHHIEITFSGKNISTKKNDSNYLIVGLGGMKGDRGEEYAREIAHHYRPFIDRDDPNRQWHHTYLKSLEKKSESDTEVTWVAIIVDPYLD